MGEPVRTTPYPRRVFRFARLHDLRGLLTGLRRRFRDADLGVNAAAVAYNAFLALVPLGAALFGVAGWVGGSAEALERVERTLLVLAPEGVVTFLVDLMEEAADTLDGQQSWLIPVSVLLSVLLGARAVAALQKALARVENLTEARPAVQLRLVAMALTVGGGLALLITSFLLVGGRAVIDFLTELTGFGALDTIWLWVRIPVSALGLYAFLLAFYQYGPPEPLPKSWLAALVATIGAVLASLGFGLYLANSPSLGATFGVLGTVAIALVWLYLGAFAILLGGVVVAYTLRWQAS